MSFDNGSLRRRLAMIISPASMLMLLVGCESLGDPKPVTELSEVWAAAPSQLTAACSSPVELPGATISAGAAERAWAQDRSSLVDCGARHSAVVSFYAQRDSRLAGKQ